MIALAAQLDELLRADTASSTARALFPKLQAVLRGSCDRSLAADPALDYDDAAELTLLLETLGGK